MQGERGRGGSIAGLWAYEPLQHVVFEATCAYDHDGDGEWKEVFSSPTCRRWENDGDWIELRRHEVEKD